MYSYFLLGHSLIYSLFINVSEIIDKLHKYNGAYLLYNFKERLHI